MFLWNLLPSQKSDIVKRSLDILTRVAVLRGVEGGARSHGETVYALGR
jgi:hypothetical protein